MENKKEHAKYDFKCPKCGCSHLYMNHGNGNFELIECLSRILSPDGGTSLEFYIPSPGVDGLGISHLEGKPEKKYICGDCDSGWDFVDYILDDNGLRLRITDERMLALAREADEAAALALAEAERENIELLNSDRFVEWKPLNRVMVRLSAFNSRLVAEGFTAPDIFKAAEMLADWKRKATH